MSTTMRRQLERLKSELETMKPAKPVSVKVLMEPAPQASQQDWADHHKDVAEARATNERVIVVRFVSLGGSDRDEVPGVKYCETEAEAMIQAAALQPSEQGNATRLDDVLQGLSGRVIGPSFAGDCCLDA